MNAFSAEFLMLMQRVEKLLDAHRPLSAVDMLEPALDRFPSDVEKAILRYNLGVTYRSRLGDGVHARERFIASAQHFVAAGRLPDAVAALLPNAIENLMVLAVSFEDYEKWGNELRRLHPGADILRGQAPEIIDLRNRGHSWSDAMEQIAIGYYSRSDPQMDPGLYGEAASLFHLMVTHRRELRVDREHWRRAVIELLVLRHRLLSDTAQKAEHEDPTIDPREFVSPVTNALSLARDYLAASPNDTNLDDLCANVRRWTDALSTPRPRRPESEHGNAAMSTRGSTPSNVSIACPSCGRAIKTASLICPSCGHHLVNMPLVAFTGLGVGVLAFFGLRQAFASVPVWLDAVASIVVANVASAVMGAGQLARHSSRVSSSADKSPASLRQERIDQMLGIRRSSDVRCRNGHQMLPLEDEGVLLARCPMCGIVKPYPGTFARLSDVERVASKYSDFDL
jgi:hypothetical protein